MVSRAIASSKTPLRLLTNNFNPECRKIVEEIQRYVSSHPLTKDYIWFGRGWDLPSRSKEHGTGRAVDIIITERVGKARTPKEFAAGKHLVDVILKHGKALGVQWVLFSLDGRVTWSFNFDRGTWTKLANRGSIPANHVDHIHLYFKSSAKLPRGFRLGSDEHVTNITLSHIVSAAKNDPSKPHSNPGRYGAEVKIVEDALVAEGLLSRKYSDGHFGTSTIEAYSRFQESRGYRGKDADGIPGFTTLTELGRRHGFRVIS